MIKKALLAGSIFSMLAASTALAVPVTNLSDTGFGAGLGTKESYIEAKVDPKVTVGYEYLDRDNQGHHNDIYGKYNLVGSNVQLVGGWRGNMAHQSDAVYGGVAVSAPSFLGFRPYASYVKGSNFGEAQLCVNYNIVAGVGVNVNYHNYVPDNGSNEHGVGAGLTIKF